MLQNRTWFLIGRKLANEATDSELRELEEMLHADPALRYTLHTLSTISLENATDNYLQIDRAYAAHLSRMKEMGIVLPETDHANALAALPAAGPAEPLEDSNWVAADLGNEYFGRADYGSGDLPPIKARGRRSLLVAVMLLVLAIPLAYYYLQPNNNDAALADAAEQPQNTISTPYGSRSYTILPDQTKVWLNAGSTVTYGRNFGVRDREVILTGEAYFDVTHDAKKPFIIHTRAMDIRVLGTAFNVRSYPDEQTTEASLIRGSIEVTLNNRRSQKIILRPNEKLVVDSDSMTKPQQQTVTLPAPQVAAVQHLNYFSQDSTVMETSWVYNRLIFEDESFLEVARRMERWYGVDIRFANRELEQLRFTGNFREETVQEALTAMRIAASFQYTIDNNTINITN